MSMGPVCISESVVNFQKALYTWRHDNFQATHPGKLINLPIAKIMMQTSTPFFLDEQKPEWQDWIGRCLGRVMAHETFHTIYAYDHEKKKSWAEHPEMNITDFSKNYLEALGGGYKPFRATNDVTFSPAAQKAMRKQLDKLASMYKGTKSLPQPTYPIDRGSPSQLEIQPLITKTQYFQLIKKQEEMIEAYTKKALKQKKASKQPA